MSSWLPVNLQGSLDSIKNQVANSLNQVLNEDEDEDETEQATRGEAAAAVSSREQEMEALLMENEAELKRFADDNKALRRQIEELKKEKTEPSETSEPVVDGKSLSCDEECLQMAEKWNTDSTKRAILFIEALEAITKLRKLQETGVSAEDSEPTDDNSDKIELKDELDLTKSKLVATEDMCKALTSQRDLLQSENHEHKDTINQLKDSLASLKSSVKDLETAVVTQSDANARLQEDLLKSKAINNDLIKDMEELNSKAKEHEKSFSELSEQMDSLKQSDNSIESLRQALDEKQGQMENLKIDLDEKRQRIDTMNNEAVLYKDQYENLLGEYNQYLEDLETLQKKNAMQEELKNLLQEQNEQMEIKNNELKTELEDTRSTLDGIKGREEQRKENIKKLEERTNQLESSLLKELSQKRTLEQQLEDKDLQITDLKTKLDEGADPESDFMALKTKCEVLEQEKQSLVLQLEEKEVTKHSHELEKDLEHSKNGHEKSIGKLHQCSQTDFSYEDGYNDEFFNEDDDEESKCFEEQSEHLKAVESELERYKQQLSDSESNFKDHSKQFSDLQLEMESYISQMEEERTQLSQLEEEFENCKQQLAQKTSESDKLKEKVKELETENSKLLQSLDKEKDAVKSLEASENEMKLQVQAIRDELSALEGENSELKETKISLQNELESKTKNYVQLEVNCSDLEDLISKKDQLLKTEISSRDENITKLVNELQQLKSESKGNSDFEKQQLIGVLNEKSRELTALRAENGRLKTNLGQQANELRQLQDSLNTKQEEEERVAKETVEKLSLLIRDKDMEIKSLNDKIHSLEQIIQQREQLQEDRQQSSHNELSDTVKSTEEVNRLREQVHRLEMKLSLQDLKLSAMRGQRQRKRFHSESLSHQSEYVDKGHIQLIETSSGDEDATATQDAKVCELQTRIRHLESEIAEKNEEVIAINRLTEEKEEILAKAMDDSRAAKRKIDNLELHQADATRRINNLTQEAEAWASDKKELTATIHKLEASLQEKSHSLSLALNNLKQLKSSQPSQSATSSSSMQSQISLLSSERDALKLKCSEAERQKKELQREMSAVIEKKRRVEIELERLREHLIKVEDNSTKDTVELEKRAQELRKKLRDTEERLRTTSSLHTTLKNQLETEKKTLAQQVEALRADRDRLSGLVVKHETQKNALENLTMVLEGFQREKENDLKLAQKDFKERLERERSKQSRLESEVESLRVQLSEANDGLNAASRLSQQLDLRTEQVEQLKSEIQTLETRLDNTKKKLDESRSDEVGKVDKALIKNLVVGYSMVSKDMTKAHEALRVIATVLDFNAEERIKTGLDSKPWMSSRSVKSDESLTQAFVQFLQNESTPQRAVPRLPVQAMVNDATRSSSSNSESNSSFVSTRSSSSILRHALADAKNEEQIKKEEKDTEQSAKTIEM